LAQVARQLYWVYTKTAQNQNGPDQNCPQIFGMSKTAHTEVQNGPTNVLVNARYIPAVAMPAEVVVAVFRHLMTPVYPQHKPDRR